MRCSARAVPSTDNLAQGVSFCAVGFPPARLLCQPTKAPYSLLPALDFSCESQTRCAALYRAAACPVLTTSRRE